MKYEEALRKAVSCLKLSQSSNQHEAALAAAKAQEIIDRYNLQIEDIKRGDQSKEPEEDILNFGNDPLHEVCQVDSRWTIRLASTIARMNSCRIYYSTKMSGSAIIKLIGRPSDISTVRYLFGWMETEVRRITHQECKGHSRRYQIDFRTGVVDTIQRKLEEQRKATYSRVKQEVDNPMALMRVEQSIAKVEARGLAVDKWIENNMKLRASRSRRQADWSARAHGQSAGEQIRITQAKGGIGAGLPQIDRE